MSKIIKQPKNVRRSWGIACCRYDEDNNMSIVLVRKRCTYGFMAFVLGKYRSNDDNSIIDLLNQTTIGEKLLIRSMDFDSIWFNAFLEKPNQTAPDEYIYPVGHNCKAKKYESYLKLRNKFDTSFGTKKGRLQSLILKATHHEEQPWQIPRGRKRDDEMELDCAIREFDEETNIKLESYTILFDIDSITESISRGSIHYNHDYFPVIMSDNTELPPIKINSPMQTVEVDGIKWAKLSDIKNDRQLHDTISRIFGAIKAHYRRKTILC